MAGRKRTTVASPARRARRRFGAALGAAVAALTLANVAQANGRFPRAQRLLEDARDPSHLVLAATYGLLVTSDGGASWRYVCEAAYGETDLPIDALTSLSSEGALLAGIYSGVSRAADSACDFQRTLGMNNREAVPDFALAASHPGRVLAIMVSIPADVAAYSRLYRSDDDGVTWRPLGQRLPAALRTPLTIDVAPSDSERVYLSGLGPDNAGVLLRSDDGGESFSISSLPTDGARAEYPYIAAVDPEDADQLYVRTDSWLYDAETGSSRANDALLYSDDAGATFSELARAGGKLFGFAFSPDGSELVLGYGDPLEAGGNRFTSPDALGIYRGPKSSRAFEKRYAGSVGCLTWTEQGLYACTHESETGFALGLITDTDFDLAAAAQLQPLLMLGEVAGPFECGACAAGAVCRNYWMPTCQGWGRTDCVELEPLTCSPAGGEGGTGGQMTAVTAGAAGADTSALGGAPSISGAGSAEALGVRGGCDCRSSGGDGAGGSGALLGVLLTRALRRRRR